MGKSIRLAVIENKKLLLVKKRDSWILPGGKPDNGEGDLECLSREIREELQVRAVIMEFYNSFTGSVQHKKRPWTEVVYFGTINGVIKPSAEISDARFAGNFQDYNLSDVTKKIIKSLKNDRYL